MAKRTRAKAEFEVLYTDPKTLIPYPNNTKKHTESQISMLAGVLLEYNFDVPIVVDSDNVIIKGHARREAAILAGINSVPVIVRSDLTPAQIKAARIADNKLAESEWDYGLLKVELEDLKGLGVDLGLTGFDSNVIDALLEADDNFSFNNEEDIEEDYEPDDMDEDVDGVKDGKSWLVMLSFAEKARAEEFCRLLGMPNSKFVLNSMSKTFDGDNLSFEEAFGLSEAVE